MGGLVAALALMGVAALPARIRGLAAGIRGVATGIGAFTLGVRSLAIGVRSTDTGVRSSAAVVRAVISSNEARQRCIQGRQSHWLPRWWCCPRGGGSDCWAVTLLLGLVLAAAASLSAAVLLSSLVSMEAYPTLEVPVNSSLWTVKLLQTSWGAATDLMGEEGEPDMTGAVTSVGVGAVLLRVWACWTATVGKEVKPAEGGASIYWSDRAWGQTQAWFNQPATWALLSATLTRLLRTVQVCISTSRGHKYAGGLQQDLCTLVVDADTLRSGPTAPRAGDCVLGPSWPGCSVTYHGRPKCNTITPFIHRSRQGKNRAAGRFVVRAHKHRSGSLWCKSRSGQVQARSQSNNL